MWMTVPPWRGDYCCFPHMIRHDRTDHERRIAQFSCDARRPRRVLSPPPRDGHTTLLLVDAEDPQQLAARCNRRWARLASRLFASSLDRQLAEGRSPESNLLLAARARVLVTPLTRRALVQSWQNLLAQARRPPSMRNPRAVLNCKSILACESDIQEIVDALLNPLPISARGPAMASWLLSNGTGPVYNRRCSEELSIALREAIARLDPAVPLKDG
jgi:hypothetical protein